MHMRQCYCTVLFTFPLSFSLSRNADHWPSSNRHKRRRAKRQKITLNVNKNVYYENNNKLQLLLFKNVDIFKKWWVHFVLSIFANSKLLFVRAAVSIIHSRTVISNVNLRESLRINTTVLWISTSESVSFASKRQSFFSTLYVRFFYTKTLTKWQTRLLFLL